MKTTEFIFRLNNDFYLIDNFFEREKSNPFIYKLDAVVLGDLLSSKYGIKSREDYTDTDYEFEARYYTDSKNGKSYVIRENRDYYNMFEDIEGFDYIEYFNLLMKDSDIYTSYSCCCFFLVEDEEFRKFQNRKIIRLEDAFKKFKEYYKKVENRDQHQPYLRGYKEGDEDYFCGEVDINFKKYYSLEDYEVLIMEYANTLDEEIQKTVQALEKL